MKTSIQLTVGELIVALFDETRNLNWLKAREKGLLVAILINDLMQKSPIYARATAAPRSSRAARKFAARRSTRGCVFGFGA